MNDKIASDIAQLLQSLYPVHVGNHEIGFINNILDENICWLFDGI